MKPLLLTIVLVLSTGTVTGCAQTPNYAPSTAASLQRQVADVTRAAAAKHYQAALAELDNLQRATTNAEADGRLQPKRQALIDAAIARVRRDLQSAVSVAQQAALNEKLNSLAQQQKALLAQQQQQAAEQATRQAPNKTGTATTAPQGDGRGKHHGAGKGK